MAWTCNNIGRLWKERGQPAKAMASHEQARTIRERLARENRGSDEFAENLTTSLNEIAAIDLDEHRFDKARAEILQAIERRRKVIAADPENAHSRHLLVDHLTVLIRAARELGRTDEAAEATRERDALRNSDPRFKALDARLAAVLAGSQAPNDDLERTQLAYRAYEKSLLASSARLYAEAIANDPKLAADRQYQHPYNAACAAALAGLGRGTDTPAPDDATKAKLRAQALGWLKSELSTWQDLATTGTAGNKQLVAEALDHWKEDADLAGVRDAAGLMALPEAERKEWQDLWTRVDALRECDCKVTGFSHV